MERSDEGSLFVRCHPQAAGRVAQRFAFGFLLDGMTP